MAVASSAHAALVTTQTFTAPDGTLLSSIAGNTAISGAGTNPLTINGNAVGLTLSGEDVSLDFPGTITSGSLYYGIDINLSTATATGDYFAALNEEGSTANFRARLFARSTTGGYVLGISTSSTGTGTPPAAGPAVYGTVPLTFGTTVRAVVRYDFLDGGTGTTGNDAVTLYVNPLVTAVEATNPAYVGTTATGGADASTTVGLGAFLLRQGGATTSAALTVDNLAVATDFTNAATVPTGTAVPEPTSLALIGLAGLVGLRRRR